MIQKIEVFSANPSAPELPLAGFMPSSDPIHLRNVDGLGPVKAEITSTPYATGRGELPQGSSTPKRNIVLTLGLNPNWIDQTMSSLRQILYRYFMPEHWCKLRFFSDYLPTVDIEGICESFEPNIFSQDPEIQISIINHQPDFVDVDVTSISGVVDDGTIEVVFDYIGSIDTGMELRIDRTVDNPSYTGALDVVLKSPVIPQTFSIDPITTDTIKYFKLSSVPNNKRVNNVAYSDGELTNLLAQMGDFAEWPQIKPGENSISVGAEESGQIWTLAYFNRFGGL